MHPNKLAWKVASRSKAASNVTMPIVTLNGSGVEDLIEQCDNVVRALGEAQEALYKASPHGRDYQGGGDYSSARAEHNARIGSIDKMLKDYAEIQEYLYDQKDLRARK